MIKRRLGSTPLHVAPLALGGNVFGWTVNQTDSFRLLDAFVDAGFNLIDTADMYSNWVPGNAGGESETIIGNWLASRKNRDAIVVATKVGNTMNDNKGLSRPYIRRAVHASLKRLKTDYIDLYQSHIDDPDTPQLETLEALAQLICEGKVRAIGASQFSAARLREALQTSRDAGLPGYASLQPGYNLYDRAGYEAELAAVCREHGLGVITFASLARGFLTGKYRSQADFADRVRTPWVKGLLNERGFRILAALDDVASRLAATPAQVSLAWLLARPGITAPIAGATSVTQLDELLGATRLALDAGAIEQLDRASAGS